MAEGILIAESLRVGVAVGAVPIRVTEIVRRAFAVEEVAPSQPPIWTFIRFEVDDAAAVELATVLADALDEVGGWYCDFRTATETIVVFPGQVFRYARGDRTGRLAAADHARAIGIPEPQIDWPE